MKNVYDVYIKYIDQNKHSISNLLFIYIIGVIIMYVNKMIKLLSMLAVICSTVNAMESARKPFVTKIKPLPVIEDGIAIMRPGTLLPGCYYGKDESVSDHAPVIYGELGTWNVSSPISHFAIKNNSNNSMFFNHKFHIDPNGSLINREGERVGILGASEVFLLKSVNKKPLGYAVITSQYIKRMELVFKAIKKIFNEKKDLNYMVLQEIPAKKDKTIADESVHAELNELLKPEFGQKQKLFIS